MPDISALFEKLRRFTAIFTLVLIAGCQGGFDGLGLNDKSEAPIPKKLINKMKAYGMKPSSPIMIRIFKEENVLEIWKQKDTGRYGILDTYEICKWSGKFGPKFKEGDRQAPEGFYTVNKWQLNPKSKYHLSFNMGFPNAFDRSHGRTGSHLMIHGACSSAGCYSMTDPQVQVIYALAREALEGGQKKFQIQAYPFRMTTENLFKHRESTHYKFWTMLKRGYDHFEITRVPPKVNVCNRNYVFNTTSNASYPTSGACPIMAMPNSLAIAFTERQNKHAENFEALLAKAEDRKPADFVPMGTDQALPGISVITPAAPVEVVSKKEPAITKAPQPKPTEKTVTPTANTALEQPPEDAANASQNTQPKVLKSDPFSAEAKALKEQ